MSKDLLSLTRAHYDRYPFIEGGDRRIVWWREYLRDLLADPEIQSRLALDVGCSVGEISRGLIDRGARLACLDLSVQSLRRCRQINPEAGILHASALALPFADGAFDNAIAIGVLHHTPDCRAAFREAARVLAPGGALVVFLYNRWSVYNLIYRAFRPIRNNLPLSRVPNWIVRALQPLVRLHLQQTLNNQQLRNLLGDKLWTPQATFHSVKETRRWGEEDRLTLLERRRFFLGYANVLKFQKWAASRVSPRAGQ